MEKENFIKIIDAIIAQKKELWKFSEVLDPFFETIEFCNLGDNLFFAIIEFLEDEMDAKEIDKLEGLTAITWWIYERHLDGVPLTNSDTNEKIIIKTSSELYDFLQTK